MCKTWHITYACSHAVPFRLSTCHGAHRFQPRNPSSSSSSVASCRSPVTIALRSPASCGSCARTQAEHRLVDHISALRAQCSLADDDDDFASEFSSCDYADASSSCTTNSSSVALIKAEAAFETDLRRVQRAFPDGRYKKMSRPVAATRPERTASLLRNEVWPEHVVGEEVAEPSPALTFSSDDGWDYDWMASDDEEMAEDGDDEESKCGSRTGGGKDVWNPTNWPSIGFAVGLVHDDEDGHSNDDAEETTAENPHHRTASLEPVIVDAEDFNVMPAKLNIPNDWGSGWGTNLADLHLAEPSTKSSRSFMRQPPTLAIPDDSADRYDFLDNLREATSPIYQRRSRPSMNVMT